jgi:hypothetical protein
VSISGGEIHRNLKLFPNNIEFTSFAEFESQVKAPKGWGLNQIISEEFKKRRGRLVLDKNFILHRTKEKESPSE